MESKIATIQTAGLDAKGIVRLVTAEVEITNGIGIHLVGIADRYVKESLLRIVTALQSLGFRLPGQKVVINLAPSTMFKNGAGYDLAIALGILIASEQIKVPEEILRRCLFYGELGLDGSIRGTVEKCGRAIVGEMHHLVGERPLAFVTSYDTALQAATYPDVIPYGFDNLSKVLRVIQKDTQGSLAGTANIIWNTHHWHQTIEEINNVLRSGVYPL